MTAAPSQAGYCGGRGGYVMKNWGYGIVPHALRLAPQTRSHELFLRQGPAVAVPEVIWALEATAGTQATLRMLLTAALGRMRPLAVEAVEAAAAAVTLAAWPIAPAPRAAASASAAPASAVSAVSSTTLFRTTTSLAAPVALAAAAAPLTLAGVEAGTSTTLPAPNQAPLPHLAA